MKVYFSVMGIGLGHITRCLSIAKHLRERGVECVFSTYNKATDVSRRDGFQTYDSKSLMWYEDESGRVDLERTILKGPLLFNRLASHFAHEYKVMKEIKPDLIVCDSRYSTIAASKNLAIPRIYITNQPRLFMPHKCNGKGGALNSLEDNICAFNYNFLNGHQRILLPDFPMPDSISRRHMDFHDQAPKSFTEKTCFVGPISYSRPGHSSKKEIEEACKKYDLIPGEFTYIALSGPSGASNGINDTIMKVFPDSKTPSIMATGKPCNSEITRKGNLRLVEGWIDEREALIEAANVVVCRAGLSTLSEIVSFGKRAVVIPQANQPEQESNSIGIEKLGLARCISPDEISVKTLGSAMEEVSASGEMEKAASKAKEMAAKWNGEINSARIIMEYLKSN